MRTVAELRREAQVPIPVNKDSLYKPIERLPRIFNPLRVSCRGRGGTVIRWLGVVPSHCLSLLETARSYR
jgi:hypothetical protein